MSDFDFLGFPTASGVEPAAIKVFLEGKELRVIRLNPEVNYVGRLAENHIVLNDHKVSRSHALIYYKTGQWQIEDQQSENGIFVNGSRVNSKVLQFGDKIQVGSHLLLFVEGLIGEDVDMEENLQKEDAPWRVDHTISVQDPLLQEKLIASLQKKKPEKIETSDNTPPKALPKMSFTFDIRGKTFHKEIVFEKGKKLENQANEKCVEIQIKYGPWVMYKKVDLDETS